MKKNRLMGLLALFASAGATHAETRNYYCDGGKLAFNSSTSVTLEEWSILVGLEARPDYGRFVFERPDGTYAWARTSEMTRVCQEQAACIPATTAVAGLAIGPLVRQNADGSVSLCEEPVTEVTLYTCDPSGNISTAMIPNAPDHLRNFFGLGEPPAPDAVVFRPGDGSSVWHAPDLAAMQGSCIIEQPEISPADGTWLATLRESTNNGCPPQAVAQGEAIGTSFAQQKHIIWPDPFTPAALIADDSFPRAWGKNNGRWSALVVNEDHGGVRVGALFTLAVQTPEHIILDALLDMNINATAAAATGLPAECSYFSTYDIRKIGE